MQGLPAASWHVGALVASSLLLTSCSSLDFGNLDFFSKLDLSHLNPFHHDSDTAQDKGDLAGALVDAAAAAKAQNDLVTAVTYYRSALAREPGNSKAAVGLMQSLRMSGGLDEARRVADSVLAGKPTDPAVLAEAGEVRLATGQLDDAVRLLKEAVAGDGKDATSLAALGLAYDRLGDYARADGYYEQALAIAPSDAYVLNDYAMSRLMANDLGTALKLLQRAASSPNADLRVRQNLALAYALSGDTTAAEDQTRRDLPPAQVGETLQFYRQFAAPAPAAAAAVVPPSDPPPLSRVAALAPGQLVTAAPRIDPSPLVPVTAEPLALSSSSRASPAAGERFVVQLGSYRTAPAARHAAAGFGAGGVEAKLSRRRGSDGSDWFVLITPDFARREEAERALRAAQSAGAVRPILLRYRDAGGAPARRVARSG